MRAITCIGILEGLVKMAEGMRKIWEGIGTGTKIEWEVIEVGMKITGDVLERDMRIAEEGIEADMKVAGEMIEADLKTAGEGIEAAMAVAGQGIGAAMAVAGEGKEASMKIAGEVIEADMTTALEEEIGTLPSEEGTWDLGHLTMMLCKISKNGLIGRVSSIQRGWLSCSKVKADLTSTDLGHLLGALKADLDHL